MKPRIDTVDYLRGLLGILAMLYHYDVWSGQHGAAFLGSGVAKLGVYGVAGFYVLSGISFGHVYRRLPFTGPALVDFYVRRLYRLAPLYWLALAAGLALSTAFAWRAGNASSLPTPGVLALNLTLSFGLLDPSASRVVGGWSTGCEVVFYLLFPLIVLALRSGWRWTAVVLGTSWGVAAWFAFGVLDPAAPLAGQWAAYINPLNHVHLFASGVAVAALWGRVTLRPGQCLAALLWLAAVYNLWPMGADSIGVATGWGRIVFSLVTVVTCAAVYLTPWQAPAVLARPLLFLGAASYSVYLLHPLAYRYCQAALGFVGMDLPPALLAVPVTLLASAWVYRHVEEPMVRIGRRHADRLTRRTPPVEVAPDLQPPVGARAAA